MQRRQVNNQREGRPLADARFPRRKACPANDGDVVCWGSSSTRAQPLPSRIFECIDKGCDDAASVLMHFAHRVIEQTVWLQSDADRQDVVQDAWIIVWDKVVGDTAASSAFAGRGSFEGWVKRVAVNRAKGLIRHQARQSAPVIGLPATAVKPERFTTKFVLEAQLAEAISSLPADEFEVYRLREILGLSWAEVTQRLDISETTGRKRVRRGRARVQRRLGRDGHPNSQ